MTKWWKNDENDDKWWQCDNKWCDKNDDKIMTMMTNDNKMVTKW